MKLHWLMCYWCLRMFGGALYLEGDSRRRWALDCKVTFCPAVVPFSSTWVEFTVSESSALFGGFRAFRVLGICGKRAKQGLQGAVSLLGFGV